MKKLTILLAAVFIFNMSFAHNNNGNQGVELPSSIDNVFYFRVGYSSPSWNQFGFTRDDLDGFNKYGALFEMGSIYILNSISVPENMAFGINVDFFSIYGHFFSNDNNIDSYDIGTLRLDSKVGPSFTYVLMENLAFDIYVKADINWVTASVFIEDDNTDDADSFAGIGALGVSTGLNLRYGILMLGVEYNTISAELKI